MTLPGGGIVNPSGSQRNSFGQFYVSTSGLTSVGFYSFIKNSATNDVTFEKFYDTS